MLLSDKYPFISNYFEKAIENNRLAQSLLFYGSDFDVQYSLALEIARILNCTGDKKDNCQCLNCKWIREGTHPAVKTISRIDNKPDDDTSKTVISVKQSEMIRNSLLTSSDFVRVFIFCDKDEEGNICGLNRLNFQEPTANSLLKSIEEPLGKVCFIFLTRDKEDLISTIISRSQCFFMPSKKREDYNFTGILPVFKEYWLLKRGDAFTLSENLKLLSEKLPVTEMLTQMQHYILKLLKENPKSRFLIDDMGAIEHAKKEAALGMKNDIVLDELCLTIIK